MADKLEIRLVIKPDGTVELSTHGLKGEECVAETKELESALGHVRNVSPSSPSRPFSRSSTMASMRRDSPPPGSKKCGLQQPGQRT